MEGRGKELVRLIKTGWHSIQTTSLQVGLWLLEFRDGGYWKKTHTSFNDFRDEVFGISERYGQFLIKGAETVRSLPEHLQSEITTESQARALSVAPVESRQKIIEKLSKNGGVTAEKIEQLITKTEEKEESKNRTIVRGEISDKSESETDSEPSTHTVTTPVTNHPSKSKSKKEILYDKVGTPIPGDAIPFWNRRQEVLALMDAISNVKCAIEKAKQTEDALFAGVSNNFIVDMRSAYTHLKDGALPFSVCTQCMGSFTLQKSGCSFCRNTGLIPEFRWNTQSMKEMKEMVLKNNAEHAKTHPDSPLNKKE
jgi:hypothetical protein